jgi:hypothetical protein
MSKPGRNDPCYCGSGKKYKQCHLRSDQEAELVQRSRTEAARFLRRDLPRFARDARFTADFEAALPLYWKDYYDGSNAGEMSEFEALRFLDWFVFDYELENGRRLIDLYNEEMSGDLAPEQNELLQSWLDARPAGAYELLSYNGQNLHLRDYFSDETFDVFEAGGRGNVEPGEVILTRLVPVFDQTEFSTVAAYFPNGEEAGLKERLEAARTADQETNPDATWADFLRRHNYLIIHQALEEAEKAKRPPVARLDKQRTDPPIHSFNQDHDREGTVHRQRAYGSSQPHMAPTRRKVV